MNVSHTPGPWHFLEEGRTEEEGNKCKPLTICCSAWDHLADVYDLEYATVGIPREQAIANARLMTASPDMYAILEELEDSFDQQTFEEKLSEDNDVPDDREYSVSISARQLRAISAAINKVQYGSHDAEEGDK